MVAPPDDSTAKTSKVVPNAANFSGYTDEELENLPEWLQFLASIAEECAKHDAKHAPGEEGSSRNEVEEMSHTEEPPKDPYPSSQLCVEDMKQLNGDLLGVTMW